MTWYVVAWRQLNPNLYYEAAPEERVWTISEDPTEAGWETDGGCDGYGLTKEKADLIVATLNAAGV